MLNQRDKSLERDVTPVKPGKSVSTPKPKAVKAAKPLDEAAEKKPTAAKKSIAARPVKAKAADAPRIAQLEIAHEEIAKLAYLLWEARSMTQRAGSPEDDWSRAEALLRDGSTTVS